jgi:uncharacterized protein YdeI (YjbR/CyaY-like superfamily)
MKDEYQTVEFAAASQWRSWLETHHATTDGIWIRFYKKASGLASFTYAEALDDALCYGWIDGLKRSYDDVSFLQKFTPRRARSVWSKVNVGHIERLTKAGLMTPAGLAEVERAKADGRWQAAYDSPANMVLPKDFMMALRKNKKASAFFDTLNKTNLFTIGYQLQTAKKPETRARRFEAFIAMLEKGEKPL